MPCTASATRLVPRVSGRVGGLPGRWTSLQLDIFLGRGTTRSGGGNTGCPVQAPMSFRVVQQGLAIVRAPVYRPVPGERRAGDSESGRKEMPRPWEDSWPRKLFQSSPGLDCCARACRLQARHGSRTAPTPRWPRATATLTPLDGGPYTPWLLLLSLNGSRAGFSDRHF